MSELLSDPRFWAVVAVGAVASWLYTYQHLRGGARPLRWLLAAVVLAAFVLAFVLYSWHGFVALVAISLLGWLGAPVAARLASRDR